VTKIINLFGGPGIGKSSIAAGLTYKLKKKHISCNNPYEFPKTVAWDNNISAIKELYDRTEGKPAQKIEVEETLLPTGFDIGLIKN